MASLQKNESGTYCICFRFGGQRFKRSLKTKNHKRAAGIQAKVEDAIELMETGRLEIPEHEELVKFLIRGGVPSKAPEPRTRLSLGTLIDKYIQDAPEGAYEPTTLQTMHTHIRHFKRLIPAKTPIADMKLQQFQEYVNKRTKEPGKYERQISVNTVRKEIATLRAIFKWAKSAGVHDSSLSFNALRYPKREEPREFLPFKEAVDRTRKLAPESAESKEIWEAVFLNKSETEELLDLVKAKPKLAAFVYPAFVIAAHTGARRSEIIRIEVQDVNKGFVQIRERKKKKGAHSTRRLPVSGRLQTAIDAWLQQRPSCGQLLLCHTDQSRCLSGAGDPITVHEMVHHFRLGLQGSPYERLHGWHTFRHSFCSNLAAEGTDQRLIDSWVGHTTDEMSRRYRHLFPSREEEVLRNVYG